MSAGDGRHRWVPPAKGERADIEIRDHGSIWLLTPVSESAQIWCAQNIDQSGSRWPVPDRDRLLSAYAIEARFLSAILDGAAAAELTVDWS